MNIILHEFKANLKSIIIWILSLSLLFYVASIEFEMFQGDPNIQEAMATFQYMFDALGATAADMTTAAGFLSLVSIYIYLPLSIYSGLLGSGIISKEEQNKTAEYLYTLPVSRNKVIFSKFVVAVTNSILINIILMFVCYLSFGRFSSAGDDFNIFILNLALGVLLTQLIFLSLGMVLASVLRQYKRSGGITISILITAFMLNMVVGLVEESEFLKYVTPFSYYTSGAMLAGEFELSFILITIGIIVLSTTGLFYFYKKRDLYI